MFEENEFQEIDTIILATGFKVNFDLFNEKLIEIIKVLPKEKIELKI